MQMLGKQEPTATVAVKDLNRSREFYGTTLGLQPRHDEGDHAVEYITGKTALLVYRSEFAGTNKATSVTWTVDDVPGLVESLKSKGVRFEHYDLPGMTREGDIHLAGHMKAAWFKDPDGNIHALVSE
jgi:catechol 2,3-dioxygenase-like lactoylglutathione lyase family enzyme